MYAHQVIEDIQKLNGKLRINQELMNSTVDNIKKAQKFYLGQAEEIHKLVNSDVTLFNNEKYLNMPFDKCYFEYDQNPQSIVNGIPSSKEAVLMQRIFPKKDYIFFCVVISYFNQFKSWAVSPLAFIIGINKVFDESDLRDLQAWGIPIEKYKSGSGNILDLITTKMPEEIYKQEKRGCCTNFTVVHKALLLLNCKNITTDIIKAPEALNKKRRKNGKQEIFDYHVLNVNVPSRKGEYREKTEPLSHVRVHLCRGHFKEYTEEHPLFGRLTGLYWWQPHVRGQNKDGIVIKDYKIKTQEAEYGQIGRP